MRSREWVWLAVLAITLALVGASSTVAQVNTANLSGQVLDPQKAAVPGAKVTVKNLATGATRSSESDASGRYVFVGLPPGRYELAVEAKGFTKLVNAELVLTIGQAAEFDASLTIQSGTDTVTVTEATELIETARTAVTQTIDSLRITNLPINARDYINFTMLNSQARRDSGQFIGAAPTSGINLLGQNARRNEVSVDGADAVDNSVNGIRSTVSQEAVQEFQIILSNYMPEFGRAAAGVINIVTKSGSNEVHGNVFGFLRHKNIQARNPFSVQIDPATGQLKGVKQPFTRVQAGATLGGPIQKDKTFYFLSYEIRRRQESGFSDIGANNFGLEAPTPIPCVGDPSTGTPIPLVLTTDQIGFYTAALGPFQAAGACGTDPTARALIGAALITGASSNVALDGGLGAGVAALLGLPSALGTSFFPPAFAGVLAPLPASYVPLRSLIGNFPTTDKTSIWSARLDHIWNPRNSSFLRATVTPSLVTGIQVNGQNQAAGTNAASRTSTQQFRDLTIIGQHSTTFSSMLNEARFQFARRGLHYGFSQLPGPNPSLLPGAQVGVDILGVASFGREPFSTVDRIERRFQWMDNVSWIKGRHTIKFGGDFNLIQIRSHTNQVFQLDFGGLYRFSALPASATGLPTSLSAVQAYGLGVPGAFLQGMGSSGRAFDNKPIAFFLQDSWKIHPRLTMNYGVRYDYEISPIFKPASDINAAAEKALGVTEGIPHDTNNVAPRFALAWDPLGNGKTVVRAGYGLFYDHPPLATPFLSTTSDGALSAQYTFAPGGASLAALSPFTFSVLNATNIFQGILNAPAAFNLGYQANGNLQRFDSFLSNSFFTNENFLQPGTALPLPVLPFTFPVNAHFVYGYAQQANLTIEHEIAKDYKFSIGYTFAHGLHLNRPRNINSPDPALLLKNAGAAIAAGITSPGSNPLGVQVPVAPPDPTSVFPCPAGLFPPTTTCFNTAGGGSMALIAPGAFGAGFTGPFFSGTPVGFIGTPAVFNFFRPSGPNPTFAPLGLPLSTLQALATLGGFPVGPGIVIPFSDASNQESSGNSVYHALTIEFSKRFSRHFEFLSSYTWSHAIDDSTDLESPLNPQNNRNPNLDRGNSTFDQRHRWVFSAVFESPYKRSDSGWARKFLADFTVAPIVEVASGRPFNILSGGDFNLDFGPTTDRPSVVSSGGKQSPFIPGVNFGLPDRCPVTVPSITDTEGLGCTGNLGRNRFTRPKFFQVDLRISRKFYFAEKVNLEFIAESFNLLNRFNVADVNLLCDPTPGTGPGTCRAGEPTAAFDPRQFQFALKINF